MNKSSKKSVEGINARLALVMKSGKFNLGYKQSLKQIRAGKGTLLDDLLESFLIFRSYSILFNSWITYGRFRIFICSIRFIVTFC